MSNTDPQPRVPETLDEELIGAEEEALLSTLTDAARIERIREELEEGFRALAHVGAEASFFGSARTPPDDPEYALARETARMIGDEGMAVITGGGPGVMEAANRGARDAGALSIGLGIELPFEQALNGHLDIALEFHYFFARTIMFVRYASGCSARARSRRTTWTSSRSPTTRPRCVSGSCRPPIARRGHRVVAFPDLVDVTREPVRQLGVLQLEHVLGVALARARQVERAGEDPVVRDRDLRVHEVVRRLRGVARGGLAAEVGVLEHRAEDRDLPGGAAVGAPLVHDQVHLGAVDDPAQVHARLGRHLGERAQHRTGGDHRRGDPDPPPGPAHGPRDPMRELLAV